MKKKGFIWNTLGSGIFAVNGFLMLMLVSRIKGTAVAGEFGIGWTTAHILFIVGLFGMNSFQMTDYDEEYRFADYFWVKVFSTGLMVVGCAASIWLLDFSGNKSLFTVLLTGYMVLNSFAELYQSMYFQKNRIDLSGKSLFYRTFFSMLSFILILYVTQNVLLGLIAMLLINLGLTWWWILPSKQFNLGGIEWRKKQVCQLARTCTPLFLSAFLSILSLNAPKYILEHFSDDVTQGYFNMIFMPASVINLLSGFVFKPLLNDYGEAFRNRDASRFYKIFRKNIAFLLGVEILCCAGAWVLGTPVMGLLYKADLSAYRVPLLLIVIGGGFMATINLLYYLLVLLRRQKLILINYAAVSVISFAIGIPLVQSYGIFGASLSFLISYLLSVFLSFGILHFSLRRIKNA